MPTIVISQVYGTRMKLMFTILMNNSSELQKKYENSLQLKNIADFGSKLFCCFCWYLKILITCMKSELCYNCTNVGLVIKMLSICVCTEVYWGCAKIKVIKINLWLEIVYKKLIKWMFLQRDQYVNPNTWEFAKDKWSIN